MSEETETDTIEGLNESEEQTNVVEESQGNAENEGTPEAESREAESREAEAKPVEAKPYRIQHGATNSKVNSWNIYLAMF